MTVTKHPTGTLESQIREIALDYSSVDEVELTDHSKLLEIVDSLGVSELFQFVEDHIGRPLREEEMTRAKFDSIASVAGLIRMETMD